MASICEGACSRLHDNTMVERVNGGNMCTPPSYSLPATIFPCAAAAAELLYLCQPKHCVKTIEGKHGSLGRLFTIALGSKHSGHGCSSAAPRALQQVVYVFCSLAD